MKKSSLFVSLFLLASMSLFAAGNDPFTNSIDNIIDFLQGPIVRGIAILAFIVTGLTMMITKAQGAKIAFIAIAGGLVVVFGAPQLYDIIAG